MSLIRLVEDLVLSDSYIAGYPPPRSSAEGDPYGMKFIGQSRFTAAFRNSRLASACMKYKTLSFRHADVILREPGFAQESEELLSVLSTITDQEIMDQHESYSGSQKSLSRAINDKLKHYLTDHGWAAESPIFQDTRYSGEKWRLDFAKGLISVEVAFNHGEATAWNLLKPVLASELNHVEKAIQTQAGVIITCTEALKAEGGFDSAVGTFEKFIDYLKPLGSVLTVPILLIGLEPFNTFYIQHRQAGPRKKTGDVVMKGG